MKKLRESSDPYYDLNDDFDLIVASFQAQYGIRLAKDLSGMKFREFTALLGGLTDKTPLGAIVAIRSENDPERLKEFTPAQRRIRSEYRRKSAKTMPQKKVDDFIESMKQALINMSGGVPDGKS